MSLNSFGNGLRTGWAGKAVMGVLALGMLVTAFTGLGAILTGRDQIGGSSAQQTTPDQTIATVNGVPITRQTFERSYEQLKQQQEQYQPVSLLSMGYVRASALQQIEQGILTAQIARQQGISVTDKDLNDEKEKVYSTLRTQLSLPKTASADDINAALQQHGAGTLDALVPEDALKQDILIHKYQDALTKKYTATDKDVQDYYHQVHTRHILIDNKKRPDAQAKQQAQQLIAQIKAGGDFAALAREHSDDPGTKMKGGDDGFIDQSTGYVPEFKDAALKLSKGQITDQPVLTSAYGYFIIQATDTRENLPKDFDKKKAMYTAQVSQSLQQKQEQADMTAAQKEAKIVGIDPETKGDIAFQQANTDAADIGKRNADLNAAIADYDTALKSSDLTRQAEVHAQLSSIYQMLNQPDKELPELVAALKYSPDPQGEMQLGDLYKQKGDTKDALAQYQLASDGAFDNPFIHMQLSQSYQSLKQPQLAAKEQALFKEGQARQQQAMAMPQITMPAPKKK